jgi:hypothetical protein
VRNVTSEVAFRAEWPAWGTASRSRSRSRRRGRRRLVASETHSVPLAAPPAGRRIPTRLSPRSQRTPQPWNSHASAENNERPAANRRQLTPPDFTAQRQLGHVDEATSRNEARSPPHSSASSISTRLWPASKAERAASTNSASLTPTPIFRASSSRSLSTVVLIHVLSTASPCHGHAIALKENVPGN